jgi:hypothetical protein
VGVAVGEGVGAGVGDGVGAGVGGVGSGVGAGVGARHTLQIHDRKEVQGATLLAVLKCNTVLLLR